MKNLKNIIEQQIIRCNKITKQENYEYTRGHRTYHELKGMLKAGKALDITIRLSLNDDYMIKLKTFEIE